MHVFNYDSIDSTNEQAKRLIRLGRIGDSACIRAREQTAGRGTQGRQWQSPRDAGIYLSVVRMLDEPLAATAESITQSVGRACAGTLLRVTGVKVDLRGVNDLYVSGRKLGGILTEVLFTGPIAEAVVVGIGINLRSGCVQLPPGAPAQPIALDELRSELSEATLWTALAGDIETLLLRVCFSSP